MANENEHSPLNGAALADSLATQHQLRAAAVYRPGNGGTQVQDCPNPDAPHYTPERVSFAELIERGTEDRAHPSDAEIQPEQPGGLPFELSRTQAPIAELQAGMEAEKRTKQTEMDFKRFTDRVQQGIRGAVRD